MKKYYAIQLSEHDGPQRAAVYLAPDVDAIIAAQARAALSGMNAAKLRRDLERANANGAGVAWRAAARIAELDDKVLDMRKLLREVSCECHVWQGRGRNQCPRCAALDL